MKTIGLTFGGDSCEHDISVITAFSVINSINDIFNIVPIYIKNGKFYISKKTVKFNKIVNFLKKKFKEVGFSAGSLYCLGMKDKRIKLDCVLICNHGGGGENGALCGVFEMAGIPYTSAGIFQSALFMDKIFTKFFLEKKKFPFVPYRVCKFEDLNSAEELGYPLIVKPARQGSSVGIGLAKTMAELVECFKFAAEFDDKILIEKALVNFTELNCAAYLSNGKIIVSDVERVGIPGEYYDFKAKYMSNEATREIPAQIDNKLTEKIKRMTTEIYKIAELKGVVRIDYLLSENGKLYVNEINTVPGSLAFYMFKRQGTDMKKLVKDIVEEAIKFFEKKEKLISSYNADVLAGFNVSKLELGVKK